MNACHMSYTVTSADPLGWQLTWIPSQMLMRQRQFVNGRIYVWVQRTAATIAIHTQINCMMSTKMPTKLDYIAILAITPLLTIQWAMTMPEGTFDMHGMPMNFTEPDAAMFNAFDNMKNEQG